MSPYDRRVSGGAQPIVGLGSGGHARSLLEALRSGGDYEVVALVDDDPERAGGEVLGVPVQAADALGELRAQARGQVGHRLVAGRAPRRPPPHLAGAEGGLAELAQGGVQEVEVHGDVA